MLRNHPLRWLDIGVGAVFGAVSYGGAGVVGGAFLGAFAHILADDVQQRPGSLWAWVRAFDLLGGSAGLILGGREGGLEGAIVGGFVGAVVGTGASLVIGFPVSLTLWVYRRFTADRDDPPR